MSPEESLSPSLILTLVFALFLLAQLATRFWLSTRQMRHVARHRDQVPAAFAARVSIDAHRKAADYTIARSRLGLLEAAFGAAVLLGWTLLGGLDLLNRWLLEALGGGMTQQVLLVVAVMAVGGLLELPFSLYQTFVIEERFGFNKMSFSLWLSDTLKSIAIGAVLGLPLLWGVLSLMGAGGSLWWLYAWVLLVVYQLFVIWIAPTFIMPIFNKFKPLEDEVLRKRVTALMERCGFRASGLFVMDGSRRSAHSNAFFTGFGATKRVVFFDTLLARLAPPEVDAVLAHELGHFKHRHVLKSMTGVFALSLAGLALLGWLSSQVWFYTGLGVSPNIAGLTTQTASNDALALLLLLFVAPVFMFFVSPVFTLLSRRNEFEADAFAMAQTDGAHLASALLKLYEDNASTLTPDPVFANFYYSHPPATERLARMTSTGAA